MYMEVEVQDQERPTGSGKELLYERFGPRKWGCSGLSRL